MINRGTGAGGSNTNANGLSYESLVNLSNIIPPHFVRFTKSKFHDELIRMGLRDADVPAMHGCRQPDEAYFDAENKKLFIFEKKFQQTSGSVCEKLQTGDAKRDNYSEMFPTIRVEYIYILSDWFKENCKYELKYLSKRNIPVLWEVTRIWKKA